MAEEVKEVKQEIKTVRWLGQKLEASGTGREKLLVLRSLAPDAPAEQGVEALRRYVGGVTPDGGVRKPDVADASLTVTKARSFVLSGQWKASGRAREKAAKVFA